jgi:thiol:disulfide interchange protein
MRFLNCFLAVLGVFLLITGSAAAQTPLKWQVHSQRISPGHFALHVTGTINKGWHIYVQTDTTEDIDGLHLAFDERVLPGPAIASHVLTPLKDRLFDNRTYQVYENAVDFTQQITLKEKAPDHLDVKLVGYASNGAEFLPLSENGTVALEGGSSAVAVMPLKLTTVNLNKPVAQCGNTRQETSLFSVFILGIVGGLLALLTPCVFPMIPLTVSWFTAQSGAKSKAIRNGIIYGSFILLIYMLGSVPFHLLKTISPELFNTISTNIWVNLFFFAVFVFFALSFFGLFEITVSGRLTNKADSKSSLGSLGGMFFMALTLALVSFSCTGPILGTLLVGSLSSGKGAWALTAGMGGFGLALALPFALFAMFPGWMQQLPKSGGWLDVVKKVLAFAELAFAFKFLSNADLVAHWGILKREVFIGVWTLISLALSLYLAGYLNRSNAGQRVSLARKAIAIIPLVFALYLLPGLTNTKYAELNLLSGFPPPPTYSIYPTSKNKHEIRPQAMNDYLAAVKLAKAQHKPILIDFTGWACVNCRKMEENVWTQPAVSDYIKKNFILVSLYVDDRTNLSADERAGYADNTRATREVYTQGDKWAAFESLTFGQVTQPLYAILTPDGKLMNSPVGYTPDQTAYLDWLKCGFTASKNY